VLLFPNCPLALAPQHSAVGYDEDREHTAADEGQAEVTRI
jgi:hypothetical protein